MGKLVLYYVPHNPSSGAVIAFAKAINLELELKLVDSLNQENLTESYIKMNPAHTFPVLVDDSFVVWGSNAILTYLADVYSKDESFYPKDIKQRSIVNQNLYYESSLFWKGAMILKPVLVERIPVKDIPNWKILEMKDRYLSLERLLDGKTYVNGDNVTIADISMVATTKINALAVPITKEEFPNIYKWCERMESLPYYESIQSTTSKMNDFIKMRTEKQ